MVYKIHGTFLMRDASQQADQGITLSFVEEAEPGDLAFFDNEEGHIIHVGMVLPEQQIIHASGKVRIDRLDHQGIYNEEIRGYSHQLRLLKRVL
jgi:cell wall-associated NlpC family hydrolase